MSERRRPEETRQLKVAHYRREVNVILTKLERACLGVSRDRVRRVLRDLQAAGNVECLGRGRAPDGEGIKGVMPLRKGNKEGDVAYHGLKNQPYATKVEEMM